MRRKTTTILIGLASLLAAAPNAAVADDQPQVIRIGVITDGPVVREESFVDLVKHEIEEITAGSYRVEFPADATVNGHRQPQKISAALDELQNRTDVDVILATGVGVAAEVCSRSDTTTPVVVPFAFGDCASSCPQRANVDSRRVNLNRLVSRDIHAFHDIVPFDTLAVLVDPVWRSNCTLSELADTLAPAGVEVFSIPVESKRPELSELLPIGADAVYIMPLFHLTEDELGALADELTEQGLPTFSFVGESEVDLGVLAGLNTRASMLAVARSSAIEVLDVVEDRKRKQAAGASFQSRLTLNMATARKLHFSPSWELLTRARLVHDEGARRDRPLDLATAIRQAVTVNLDLAAQGRRVAAGAEDVRHAKSRYRPRIDLGLAGVAIDENHAIAALGQYPKYAAGSLTLTQLIWSDAATADISIQKELQRIRELDLDGLKLDIARDAVTAYLNVLRTDALVGIRQQQVDLTRTNRELAELRRSLGAAGAAEVYRWDAELATSRAGLLDAIAAGSRSQRQLSRLLDEPLTTRWRLRDPDIAGALEILGGADGAILLATPEGHELLTTTLVAEGLDRSPELAALDAAIAAQERGLKTAKRASYAPRVAASADVSQILAKDTSGGLELGDIADLIPEFDDTAWQVGVQATLPLVTGGANKAERLQAQEELFALRTDRRNTEEKLAQRTLSALDTATASWSTISLRRQAADAAAQTLELVRDAYGRGAASVIDLLDAQNSSLSAELAAETAIYDFLDDWTEVQRSVAGLPVRP